MVMFLGCFLYIYSAYFLYCNLNLFSNSYAVSRYYLVEIACPISPPSLVSSARLTLLMFQILLQSLGPVFGWFRSTFQVSRACLSCTFSCSHQVLFSASLETSTSYCYICPLSTEVRISFSYFSFSFLLFLYLVS